jgi:transposase InsO family protein
LLLKLAKLPRSNYYYTVNQLKASPRHEEERAAIRTICAEHQGRYGYRRVTLALREKGYQTNHKLVMKLMKIEGLTCQLRKKRYRSYKGQVGKIAPNLLNRNFTATRPNQKWVTDVTEFKVLGKRIYLSPILDLFNGEVVSYSLAGSPSFASTIEMLKKAFRCLPEKVNLILHSDQGWQYQMKPYQRLLAEKGIQQSMSRKGNCYDNAVIENFFGLLKSEFFDKRTFPSVDAFQNELVDYLEYYNNDRIKVKLKGLSPVAYRAQSNFST